MLKNNKGVTILVLVITIVVLLVLVGISITTGFTVIDEVRAGRIISEMTLVQSKVETIYEQYQFDGNINNLKLSEDKTEYKTNELDVVLPDEEKTAIAQKAGVDNINDWSWYKWDRDVLKSQGLDPSMLPEGKCYYVNYEHAEIIGSEGTKFDESVYYSMSGLKSVYRN